MTKEFYTITPHTKLFLKVALMDLITVTEESLRISFILGSDHPINLNQKEKLKGYKDLLTRLDEETKDED